jgi:hypothetical protein
MGQSQLLIIAVCVLIIGVAIFAAAGTFQSSDITLNKKAMINDVNQIAHLAIRYYSRPGALGGGGHSFVGFVIPAKFQSNQNGTYSVTQLSPTGLQVRGVSVRASNNTMVAQIDTYGKVSSWTFAGDFQ